MLNEETLLFVKAHREDDVRRLALKPVPPGVDLRQALTQIEGWQTARLKLPSWAAREGMLYPPKLAMEQCSSEQAALYKQRLVGRWLRTEGRVDAAPVLLDLTGGFGVDFSFLAPLFARAVYMERQPGLCGLARHNFGVLGLSQAEVREADSARSVGDWPEADCCFVDPARRGAGGRKTVALEDCEPDLSSLCADILRKSRFCVAKLSPMLDVSMALRALPRVAEVHAVSVQGECKELLLVVTRRDAGGPVFHCANLDSGQPDFSFTRDEEAQAACEWAERPGRFLYEPNASVMKCGGFRSLASRFGMTKLHPNSHLYASERPVVDFPGRGFVVEDWCGFSKAELRSMLQGLGRANLAVRNFPERVDALRKRLGLKDGGDAYLFATTLADGKHVLLRCCKA